MISGDISGRDRVRGFADRSCREIDILVDFYPMIGVLSPSSFFVFVENFCR